MRIPLRFGLAVFLLALFISPALARKNTHHANKSSRSQTNEAATRLQVFLDRANFSPGKLDGHYGGFTLKALALYQQSRGEPPAPPAKPGSPPDVRGIDLASIDPVFISYLVTEADLQNVGPVPEPVAERAKLKALPYRSPAEAIAEKFHCDQKFLEQLNPGKTKTIKAGDELKVPNVEPFELDAVKQMKPGSEINSSATAANDLGDETAASASPSESAAPPETAGPVKMSLRVDVKTNELGVFEDGKIVAAYPVTVGSTQTASPLGEWKVRGIAKLPTFRYDEQMLQHGERSGNFAMLPPGPNNPVGVVWIALNKRGIGIHGADEPDAIGRGASHGCIRLANWDIVRLAQRVKPGVPVSVRAY